MEIRVPIAATRRNAGLASIPPVSVPLPAGVFHIGQRLLAADAFARFGDELLLVARPGGEL